jgi:hypothetical protein
MLDTRAPFWVTSTVIPVGSPPPNVFRQLSTTDDPRP